jgi:hypothetical protein
MCCPGTGVTRPPEKVLLSLNIASVYDICNDLLCHLQILLTFLIHNYQMFMLNSGDTVVFFKFASSRFEDQRMLDEALLLLGVFFSPSILACWVASLKRKIKILSVPRLSFCGWVS